VVHVFSAHGAEAGDHRAGGALGLSGPATGARPRYGLGHLRRRIIRSLCDLSDKTAFANGFIDRGAGASAEAAQGAAIEASSIVNGLATRAAGSCGHPAFVAERAIGAHGSAIEPRLVEVLASLHVKGDGDEAGIALSIRRGAAARASAEVARHAIVGQNKNRTMIVVAVTERAVTILIPVLAAGRRGTKAQHKNSCDQHAEKHTRPKD